MSNSVAHEFAAIHDRSPDDLPPTDAFDEDIHAVLMVACEDSRFLHYRDRHRLD